MLGNHISMLGIPLLVATSLLDVVPVGQGGMDIQEGAAALVGKRKNWQLVVPLARVVLLVHVLVEVPLEAASRKQAVLATACVVAQVSLEVLPVLLGVNPLSILYASEQDLDMVRTEHA